MSVAGRIAAGIATGVALALILRRLPMPLGRYVVEGPSMEPAYRAGDRIIVNRLAYRGDAPAVGDVVVLRDPERDGHVLLKRITSVGDDDAGGSRYYVTGDNAAYSRDSRAFGHVQRGAIIGRAWRKY